MKVTVRVDGLRALDAALGELPKATAKGVLRRVGKKALTPMAETARRLAPDDPDTSADDLKSSIVVGTKLNDRQKRLERRAEGKSFVTVYMGTADVAGVPQEFGTVNHGPQPFMRPAFEEHKMQAIEIVRDELGGEIERTRARAAKRAAAKAAKGI